MRMLYPLVIGLALSAALVSCAGGEVKGPEASLQRGIDLFLQNKSEAALPLLQVSVEWYPDNPDAYAWLAECLRRLQRFDDALAAARGALAIDGCHAFAHTVLGDLFNPQLSTWARSDVDSSWFHLLKAVKCDSTEGHAWSTIWIQAMRRGQKDLERQAVLKMVDSGLLSDQVLAYNRWQLRYLPANAILITNGDMDTYPSVALQAKEGLRPDVAVVNRSLLDMPWYAKAIADQYGIPFAPETKDLEALRPYKDEKGQLVLVGSQIVAGWMGLEQQGSLGRSLCQAVTVARTDFTPDTKQRCVLCGPYYEIMPAASEVRADTARMRESLEAIDPSQFEGSFAAPHDRSPVIRSGVDKLASNITLAMLAYANVLATAGRQEDARNILARAENYDSRIKAAGCCKAEMDSLSQSLGSPEGE